MDGAEHKKVKNWYLMDGTEHKETWYLMDGAEHKISEVLVPNGWY